MAKPIAKRDLVIFGLVLAGFSSALGALQLWKGQTGAASVFLAIAVLVGLTVAAAPGCLRPLHRIFAFVGHWLGWFNTRLILAVIFFGIFTPAAAIMRCLGRDPMNRSFDRGASSYWIDRDPESRGPERYERMF